MTGKWRCLKLSPKIEKTVLFVLLLLIVDILLAGLGGVFLGGRISFFSGKSATHTLCDLLFLEGAIIFAIGVFLAAGMSELIAGRSPSRLFAAPKSSAEDVAEFRPKQYSTGTILMIIGASLMGSSIAIGVLLL